MSKSEQRTGFKKGEIVVLTDGEYSDYRIEGIFRARVDFELAKICKEFVRDKPRVGEGGLKDQFFPWLVEKGYAEDLDTLELHLGGYRGFQPRFW